MSDGIHCHHCTKVEEVDPRTHLVAAYQIVHVVSSEGSTKANMCIIVL